MDLAGADRERVLSELKASLSPAITDFAVPEEELWEEAAVCDEGLLEKYLAQGRLEEGDLTGLIARRAIFPCWFGAALKLTCLLYTSPSTGCSLPTAIGTPRCSPSPPASF